MALLCWLHFSSYSLSQQEMFFVSCCIMNILHLATQPSAAPGGVILSLKSHTQHSSTSPLPLLTLAALWFYWIIVLDFLT